MALRSISRLTNVFLALFMLLSIGLVYWQVFQSRTLTASTYNPRRCDVGNQPVRGNIYDRNGVLLAYSEQDSNAPCNYRRHYCVPSLSPLLGYFSNVNETGIEKAYDGYLTGTTGPGASTLNNFWDQTLHRTTFGADIYLTIDWQVQNLIDKQFDITFDNPGDTLNPPFIKLPQSTSIGLAPGDYGSLCDKNVESHLYNPPAESAAHYHPGSVIVSDPHTGEILGMLSRPYYNAEKLGDYHLCRKYANGDNDADDSQFTSYPACSQMVPGYTEKPLAAGHSESQPDDTAPIGDIYFQVYNQDPLQPLLNRPTRGLYIPGSTFKTVTLAAALDTGRYHLTDPFGGNNCLAKDSEARTYTVNFHTFNDVDIPTYQIPPACPIDLEHGYIYSDNIIYARVGVTLGATTWLDYVQRFGITDSNNPKPFPFDIPVEPSRIAFQGDNGVEGTDHQVNLAAAAFGQGVLQLITPFTMNFVASTVANNGVAMLPHLLYKVVPHGTAAKDATMTAPAPYTGLNGTFTNGQIISPQTASQIRESMVGVVKQGSAFTIAGTRANVGGKTGTAQLCNNCPLEPHGWFISMAPDTPGGPLPQYAVTVMRENGDEGLLQAAVADCIHLSLLPGIGNPPMQNIHDGTTYPRYRCAP